MPELIAPHLKALPPIEIPYTIRVGKEYHQPQPPQDPSSSSTDEANSATQSAAASKKMQETIYDIQVSIDDPLRAQMVNFIRGISSQPPPNLTSTNASSSNSQATNNPAMTLRRLATLDEHISLYTQALIQSRNKLDFLEGFSREPVTFLRRWLSSQRRDLELILGEGVRGSTLSGPTSSTLAITNGSAGGAGGAGGAEGGAGQAGAGQGSVGQWMEMLGLGVGFDDDEWRRGGEGSLWGRQEVKEAVMSLVTSTTTGMMMGGAGAGAGPAGAGGAAAGGMGGYGGTGRRY